MTAEISARALARIEELADRFERVLPPPKRDIDFSKVSACRWRVWRGMGAECGFLEPVQRVSSIRLSDLQNIERQKQIVVRNTTQFMQGLPANDLLMTGARGTGKSSLVKACLNEFVGQGLRLVEVDRSDLGSLTEIVDALAMAPYRFVLFCDDLSFEADDPGYKALKVVLDGSVATRSANVLVYATSNRRHLMPEYLRENRETRYDEDGEIHPGESVEEKISLSERFGLWVSFHPFRQDDFLSIVEHWLTVRGVADTHFEAARPLALRWALERGSRSGRVAMQFANHFAASLLMPASNETR